MTKRNIVVVGASLGGLEPVLDIASGLPSDFPGSLFVVIHSSPSSPGLFPTIIQNRTALRVRSATDREPIRDGHLYLPPAGYHLLVRPGEVRVTTGPTENTFRPAIDPLFRTAATSYGPRIVGVILSGLLDDGARGLAAIKRLGGYAIVQDPAEAVAPAMPENAIAATSVDRVASVKEIAAILQDIVNRPLVRLSSNDPPKPAKPDIAEAGGHGIETMDYKGPPSPFTCPDCGGALWELTVEKSPYFRCHVGHGFTPDGLVSAHAHNVEAALWTAARAAEENAELQRRMAKRAASKAFGKLASTYSAKAEEYEACAEVIRKLLLERHPGADPLAGDRGPSADRAGVAEKKRSPRRRKRKSA